MDASEKEKYFNYLVESAKLLVKGGKLYGFEIDDNNLRDVLAAIYCLYINDSVMKKEVMKELELNV